MSAGGLSYSGLVNYGKTTLPSVDSWGTNMNILRDPPKSIMTRRINKVGETSSITSMIDDSSNRACEAIQVYARGVNPFVSVSYNNHGNNGGQRSGNLIAGGSTESKLPYTIMKDGAFRPPVLLQENLLPLSRMPRNSTSAFSKPGFVDFSKKMRTCGTDENTKEVKKDIIRTCARPTATYKLEQSVSEPFEVKYVIQPTITNKVSSGMRSMDITEKYNLKPTKEVYEQPFHALAHANYTDNKYVNNNTFDSTRYLQETNAHEGHTNISSNKNSTNIEDVLDLSDIPIKDTVLHSDVSAGFRGVDQTKYIHENLELAKNLPEYKASTNITDTTKFRKIDHENKLELKRNTPMGNFSSNIVKKGTSDHGSRDARINPKIQPGSYSIPAGVPSNQRISRINESYTNGKSNMNHIIMENNRYRYSV